MPDPQNPKELLFNWLLNRPSKKISFNTIFETDISIGSTTGIVRSENQDRSIIAKFAPKHIPNKSYIVCALSDGMGGMVSGGNCASICLDILLKELINSKENRLSNKLSSAVHAANDAVFNQFIGKGGTTLSAVLFDNVGGVSAINVGDSRIYESRKNGKLKQVSIDDTIEGQLLAIQKEPSGALENKQLVQFIGMGEGLDPQEVKLSNKSTLKSIILTSDGAHCVGGKNIENIINYSPNAISFSVRLLNLSEWYGGKDNATSICAYPDKIKENIKVKPELQNVIDIWDAYGSISLQTDLIYHESFNNWSGQVKVDSFFMRLL